MSTVHDTLSCPYCELPFTNPQLYDRHQLNAHGKLGKYICEFCDDAFDLAPVLASHVKQVHSGVKLKYRCPLCYEKYSSEAPLIQHNQRRHSDNPEKKKKYLFRLKSLSSSSRSATT